MEDAILTLQDVKMLSAILLGAFTGLMVELNTQRVGSDRQVDGVLFQDAIRSQSRIRVLGAFLVNMIVCASLGYFTSPMVTTLLGLESYGIKAQLFVNFLLGAVALSLLRQWIGVGSDESRLREFIHVIIKFWGRP